MSEDISKLKEDEKEAETTEVTNHRPASKSGWIPGAVLIGMGLIFLVSNFTDVPFLHNWWALFILIPAVHNFSRAWNEYQANGRLTRSARGSLSGGLFISLVAAIFLFDLDWGKVWPLFLIFGGLSALIGSRFE